MTAVQATAEKAATVVAELVRGDPLAPQLARRLVAAEARQADLEATVASFALDAMLDRPGVLARREAAENELAVARTETERLRNAHAQALQVDARKRAEAEVVALQEGLAKYEQFAAARVAAMADLTRATEVATEAGRRFLAATSLMQDGVPGHALPRGLILGRNMEASVSAVKRETDKVLEHVRRLVQTSIAWKLGKEIEHD
jgi:hypothetical protein